VELHAGEHPNAVDRPEGLGLPPRQLLDDVVWQAECTEQAQAFTATDASRRTHTGP
jgi:hypothetical protein